MSSQPKVKLHPFVVSTNQNRPKSSMTNFVVDLNAIPAIQSKVSNTPSFLSLVCQAECDRKDGMSSVICTAESGQYGDCNVPSVSSSKSTETIYLDCCTPESQDESVSNPCYLQQEAACDAVSNTKLTLPLTVEPLNYPQIQSSITSLHYRQKCIQAPLPALRFIIDNNGSQLRLHSHRCIPKEEMMQRLDLSNSDGSKYLDTTDNPMSSRTGPFHSRFLSPNNSWTSTATDSRRVTRDKLNENKVVCNGKQAYQKRLKSSSQQDLQEWKDKSWIQSVDSCLKNRRRILSPRDRKAHAQAAEAKRIKAFEERSIWRTDSSPKESRMKHLASRLPVLVLLSTGTHVLSEKPSGISRITYFPYFITKNRANIALRDVTFRSDWADTKQGLVAWCGEFQFLYNGKKLFPNRWPPCLLEIQEQIISKLHLTFNGVLLRLFQDGSHGSSWYHDVGEGILYPFALMIFGSERTFVLRKRIAEVCTKNQCTALNMPSGSIVVVEGYAIRDWESRITESLKDMPCIAATFLNVTPEENKLGISQPCTSSLANSCEISVPRSSNIISKSCNDIRMSNENGNWASISKVNSDTLPVSDTSEISTQTVNSDLESVYSEVV